MKIKSLRLKNFLLIKSGMDKDEIFLDFSSLPYLITLLVGQMGSGKTTILGHLQPGPSFGTLDDRNQLPDIIEGKNGLKEIIYDVDGHEIKCQHTYTWTKDHHAVKSYISKDGVELNPNGNQSSFRELEEIELGINANYLRLIRIGPNVSNLINLSAADRKAFMADLLSNVDIYMIIYKDIVEQVRTIQTQTQLISRKIADVSDTNLDAMRKTTKHLKRDIEDIRDKIRNTDAKISKYSEKNNLILEGRTLDEYIKELSKREKELEKLELKIDTETSNIQEATSEYKDINEVVRALGTHDAEIGNNSRLIMALQDDYTEKVDKKNKLIKDTRAVADTEYIDNLNSTFKEYQETIEAYKSDLAKFDCPYSSTELKSLLADIQSFDSILNDIMVYGFDIIHAVLDAGKGAKATANTMIERLQGRKFKLQKSLNNIQYVRKMEYDVSDELNIPDCCKVFTSCPYFITHPNTVKKSNDDKSFDKQYAEIMAEIDEIDAKMERYMVYPVVYGKIESLRAAFSSPADKLKKIRALNCKSFNYILENSSHTRWYDYDLIIDTMEKCEKREKMYMMQSKLHQIQNELETITSNDVNKLLEETEATIKQIDEDAKAIEELENNTNDIKQEIERLNEILETLTGIERTKKEIERMNAEKKELKSVITSMRDNIDAIKSNKSSITELSLHRSELLSLEAKSTNDFNVMVRRIDEISEAKAEYASLSKKLEALIYVRDAASSKKGIPLFYIKLFLNNCLDTINEMVSMIFGDSLEVLDFDITDKEFNIPYAKDGIRVEDVKYCSQGEKAVVSMALSFALMRNGLLTASTASSIVYNIILLDEIDAPLHKDEREKFLTILAQQIKAVNAEQVFLITHNNCFDGYPVNIILTSDEAIDNKTAVIIRP